MKKDIRLFFINYERIVFEVTTRTSNVDVLTPNDSMITICDGIIRDVKPNKTIKIGDFNINIIHIGMADILNVKFDDIIKGLAFGELCDDLTTINNDNSTHLNSYKKVIIVSAFILIKKYRKKNILDEFLEFLYKNYYNKDYLILFQALPFQYNEIMSELVFTFNATDSKGKITDNTIYDYYELNEFEKEDDQELNKFKLYGHMTKHGCKRIGDTDMFRFYPHYIENKIIDKNL